MSTRAQIFVEGIGASLYVHHDGYPDVPHSILAWLVPFVAEFKKRRGWDPEYMLARAVETGIRHRKEEFPADAIGWGIETEEHGDLAFAYVIKRNFTIEVRERSQSGALVEQVGVL